MAMETPGCGLAHQARVGNVGQPSDLGQVLPPEPLFSPL